MISVQSIEFSFHQPCSVLSQSVMRNEVSSITGEGAGAGCRAGNPVRVGIATGVVTVTIMDAEWAWSRGYYDQS